jgi:single-stranded-DNA-specific exonuclease
MDVIVLDHHEPPAVLPDAAAIVDPKLGGGPPDFDGLASCGLAFTTVRALCEVAGRSVDAARYLDLAALGTVADMVPLTGENRRIVHDGLRALQASKRPGVRALLAASGLDARMLDTSDLGFRLAPRINAAGRLEDASIALELLTTRNPRRAQELACALSDLNSRRQSLTQDAVALARRLADEECKGEPLIMVGHEEIPQGIVGLVAGKLVEELYRPAVVYERHDELCHGSVRSIPEFDVVRCLAQGGDLMERWGGHAQAGGFTVRTERVGQLREVFTAWARQQLADVDLRPTLDIDLETPLSGIRGDEIRWLQYLEPCGQENPTPVFVSRRVMVADSRTLGNGQKHLRLKLRDGAASWPAIAFDMGEAQPRPGARIDVVYSFGKDRGGMGLQLQIKDFAPAS